MDAAAEREMLRSAGTREVEGVGVVAPARGVTVGRTQDHEHERAGGDRAVAEFHVGGGDASRELHRRVIAEYLVDRGSRDRRIVLPALQLRADDATTRACRFR